MTKEELKIEWRIQLEYEYALICKGCHRKVIDPDKNNGNQIFTRAKCPYCSFCKDHMKSKSHKRIVC